MMSCHSVFYKGVLKVCLLTAAVVFLLSGGKHDMPVGKTEIQPSDSVENILLLGEDQASGLYDVIILASVDRATETVCLVQIPRDTYYRYTEKDYRKINGAIRELGSVSAFCQLLGETLSLPIDGYLSVNLEGIRSAVDALGGVELCVPRDMDYEDPSQGLSIHLKAGRQRLNGEQAVQFVRFRSGYVRADLGRMDAQKLFLAAFFQSARAQGPIKLSRLALSAMGSVRTDLGAGKILSLARMVQTVDETSIRMVTLPGEEVRSSVSGAWYYVVSRSGLASVMSQVDAEGAQSGVDPRHLLGNPARQEFESVYRKDILPEFYTVESLAGQGLSIQ